MDQKFLPRWLLLLLQLPPKPDYLRLKVRRQLQSLGAILLKGGVHVLPRTDDALEDFQWLRRQVLEEDGEATLIEATLLEGLSDEQVESLFRQARDSDYEALANEATQALASGGGSPALPRLRRRMNDILAIDFYGATGRSKAETALNRLEARARELEIPSPALPLSQEVLIGRTWVTRKGIHIDRMACAWLIRRFIDAKATLRFVDPKSYVHASGELRFDMFEGEFTHERELCSFEVLMAGAGLEDPALRAIADLVHDIDLKDQQHGRPEAAGLAKLIAGVCVAHPGDEARLARGKALFDDLYSAFGGKGGTP